MTTLLRWTAIPAAMVLAVGLTTPGRAVPAPAAPFDRPAAPAGAVARHVLLISVDGLRPDAIDHFDARVLQRLRDEGAHSLTARTIEPSRTLPSHTSMLTGVPPAAHGITWNSDETSTHGRVRVATVFELAHGAGFSTAAFFSKSKLRHLEKPGSLDHAQGPVGLNVQVATQTVEEAARYMRFRRPSLIFVHIAEPDIAGHTFGWMGRAYRMAVRRADGAVGRLVEAAEAAYGAGNYTVIVTADHGGHRRDHGSAHEDDMLIPWIVWGGGVRPGPIAEAINTMDTAATVLWLFGVPVPADWQGVPVTSAFEPVAVAG